MMSEKDTNLERQADEAEALSAIYGDEWCVIDEASHIFCIHVTDSPDSPKWKVNLQVHMPPDYPLHGPPEYQINGTWLRGDERMNLENKLSQTYCDNMGEDLIFLWVEAIREFLQEKTDTELPSAPLGISGRTVTQSTEADDDDDNDFDPEALGDMADIKFKPGTPVTVGVELPEIIHGETLTDRKSTFQPHLALVTEKEQVNLVLSKLYENKKIANATHNILAYRITQKSGTVCQGCDDDGETHAGSRMLHLLQIMDAKNVVVVVSRWYGGILLGPDRFKHINNCTRQVLEQAGFLRSKEGKKGPRSGKKTR